MAATQKKKQQEGPAPQVEARIDRMAVSYTHLDVYKRQRYG